MKRRGSTVQILKRLAHVLALGIVFPSAISGNEQGERIESVDFRNLHRHGSAKIIGHFGLPIGQTLTLKGVRAKPSKISNKTTLLVHSVNESEIPAYSPEGWPQLIQISNVQELPMKSTIILEGYEFAIWRGTAEKNWHIDVEFMATKVLEPGILKLDVAHP